MCSGSHLSLRKMNILPTIETGGAAQCSYNGALKDFKRGSMSAGFIYVLVNSSMPGLVKVGKTTRTPSDRVEELSGVTGVPTPFIVAYEEHFSDCDAAEQFLHTKLTERGMRVSDSREFFRARVSEVVKLVASIPTNPPAYNSENGTQEEMVRELNRLAEIINPSAPWEEILDRADRFYYGLGDCIKTIWRR